ncbi:MAG: hypothetical protein E7169_00840 [Firmicutes bacterium]|nr:hypothetical protein [Bacillota bacterium]
MNIIALLLTLGVGLFMIVGATIVFVLKNNEKIVSLSISMAFGVTIALVFAELIPEAFELMENSNRIITVLIVLVFSCLGIVILKCLDLLIPHHEHNHKDKHGDLENLEHIGLVSSIALVIHNIIEGMALYGTALSSMSLGLMVCIGIGLHNIPMGLVIASTFYKSNKSISKTLFITTIISLSTFLGGVVMFVLNNSVMNNFILGMLICITLGMIIYIALFELLPKMLCSKDKKTTILGTSLGILILFISSLF